MHTGNSANKANLMLSSLFMDLSIVNTIRLSFDRALLGLGGSGDCWKTIAIEHGAN